MLVNSLAQLQATGWMAQLSCENQHLEGAVIIFSLQCHVERDDCRRCLSKGDAADFTIDSGLKFGCSRYMQRWKRRIGAGSSCIFFPPLPPAALSLYDCGSGQCHSKTKWVFRQQKLCSVSNIAKFPFQIPPKSQRYPARSRTYYSVAQLVNPANIQAL